MSELTSKYKELLRTIINDGKVQTGRNGSTIVIPHYSFTLSHRLGLNHELKLRKMWYKSVVGEFETLVGHEPLTNVEQFEENGCKYWEAWAAEDGSLNLDYYNELHPTLENVIHQIKTDPYSRRHVISLWNNDNAFNDTLSLHCCWHNLTFSVIDKTLHLTWTQRSVDTMVGLPADIYLSYLFMEYVANRTDLKIGSCMYSLSNVHIYSEHMDGVSEILDRTEADYNKPIKFELKA